MLVIYLLTIFAAWSTPTIVRASIGKIERGIISQLRDRMEAHLSHHLQGIVMTEFPIEQKVHTTLKASPICSFNHLTFLDETKRRAQCYLATIAVLAPGGVLVGHWPSSGAALA